MQSYVKDRKISPSMKFRNLLCNKKRICSYATQGELRKKNYNKQTQANCFQENFQAKISYQNNSHKVRVKDLLGKFPFNFSRYTSGGTGNLPTEFLKSAEFHKKAWSICCRSALLLTTFSSKTKLGARYAYSVSIYFNIIKFVLFCPEHVFTVSF